MIGLKAGIVAGVWVALAVGASPLQADALDDLQPGEWLEAPNSAMAPHMPPVTDEDWGGREGIMSAWSGGAFDTARGRLIIWGGGHHDYAGNEIYVFDVETMAWSRLTDRSADVGGDERSGYYPDGLPRSRHTYEYIEYVPPPFDRFCSFGGVALFPSGQIGIRNVDCFDFETLTWEARAEIPGGAGQVAAIDPDTGDVWVQAGGNGPLTHYDPDADAWTSHVSIPSGWFDYYATAEIDPVRDRLVAVGNGETLVWDLQRPDDDPVRLQTTGATAIEGVGNPGVAYDPVSDRIVAYGGGANVYTLDLDTRVWSLHEAASTNAVTPPGAASNGTYGRFRYVPSRNVFIVVHAINQSVYFYRLAPGAGVVPDPLPDRGGDGSDSGGEGDAPTQDPEEEPGAPRGGSGDDSADCGCRTGSTSASDWALAVVVAIVLARRERRGLIDTPTPAR